MLTEMLSVPWFSDLRLPYQFRWEYVTDHKEWFIDGSDPRHLDVAHRAC